MGFLKRKGSNTISSDDDYFQIGGQGKEGWLAEDYEEGQLSIDVYQDENNLVVKSTIAGVDHENIDISIHNDMLTIRGKREDQDRVAEENYLYRECYWGPFSRTIILPFEVRTDKVEAAMENGILTITMPKVKKNKEVSIKVKQR
jgi:HSP20 family protein